MLRSARGRRRGREKTQKQEQGPLSPLSEKVTAANDDDQKAADAEAVVTSSEPAAADTTIIGDHASLRERGAVEESGEGNLSCHRRHLPSGCWGYHRREKFLRES